MNMNSSQLRVHVEALRTRLETQAGAHQEGTRVAFGTALYPRFLDAQGYYGVVLIADGECQGMFRTSHESGVFEALDGNDGDFFAGCADQTEALARLESALFAPENVADAQANVVGHGLQESIAAQIAACL